MNKIDAGQTLSLLANVGVILGILLLVYELNQNTAAMQGDTYQALLGSVTNISIAVAQDADLDRIVSIGNSRPTELGDEDWSRYRNYKLGQVWQFGYAYLAYDRGEMNESQWSAIVPAFSLLVCEPGFQRWWSELGSAVSAADFGEYVRDKMSTCEVQ